MYKNISNIHLKTLYIYNSTIKTNYVHIIIVIVHKVLYLILIQRFYITAQEAMFIQQGTIK